MVKTTFHINKGNIYIGGERERILLLGNRVIETRNIFLPETIGNQTKYLKQWLAGIEHWTK